MFSNYRLEKQGDGYNVILYLDFSSEFAKELGTNKEGSAKTIDQEAKNFIRKRLSKFKVNLVKVMVGSTLLAVIPFTPHSASAHNVEFNMSYLYFGNTESYLKQIERTQGNLSVTSPSYFDINTDGSLKLTKQLDQQFIQEMHKKGIKVVPFLSNHWDKTIGRAALANREQLSQQIADAIANYDLDGVNVDIENVTDVDRENYTDLVRLIREKVPEGKEVSVAVAANPNNWQKGWHGSYDYRELAKYADYIMIMAYDESYPGGPEGPVASLPWVEKSIQYTLNHDVPSEKIVLGLPFYGRYWMEGKQTGGNGISNVRVEELLRKYESNVIYDEIKQSPKATVTIHPDDPVTTIAGKVLEPGTYHIWFENNESISKKMELVHKYNLKGTGSWSLGQEDPSLWNQFAVWMKGHEGTTEQVVKDVTKDKPIPFLDIENHWAESDIISIYQKGWMTGMKETVFSTENALTRAQAATILVRALNLQPTAAIETSFSDVSHQHWAWKNIEIANQHQMMRGVGENEFAPDEPITREQMAVLLDRIVDQPQVDAASTSSTFSDVDNDRWSYPSIYRMNQEGIFQGMGNNLFKPMDKLTRAQMASLLNRVSPILEEKAKQQQVLIPGSEGLAVKQLQSDLAYLGYFDVRITGYYGSVTYEAVKKFQADYQLKVDGYAGPNTLEKIKEEVSRLSNEQS